MPMSESKKKTLIFHLFRNDGGSLIVHPFVNPEKLMQGLEESEIVGRYGAEPRVEALTLLKNDLYRLVETGVRNWLYDMRFIPKFLISAGLFVVVYFFMTFVIRDPLPIVDEIAIALGASIVRFILIGRRDIKSDTAAKRRLSLRTAVDRVSFTESPFVVRLEEYLHETESGTLEEVVQKIVDPNDKLEIDEAQRDEARQFVKACEAMFRLKNAKRDEKMLKRYLERTSKGEPAQDIKKWAESRKIDFPLYAVYKRFKRTVVGSK